VQYIEDHDYGLLRHAYDLASMVGLDPDEVGKALLGLNGEYLRSDRRALSSSQTTSPAS
jgi:hypothetical protein